MRRPRDLSFTRPTLSSSAATTLTPPRGVLHKRWKLVVGIVLGTDGALAARPLPVHGTGVVGGEDEGCTVESTDPGQKIARRGTLPGAGASE
jgi:hypothetical protein